MDISFNPWKLTFYIYSDNNWSMEINIIKTVLFLYIVYLLVKITGRYIRKHNPYMMIRIWEVKNKFKSLRKK